MDAKSIVAAVAVMGRDELMRQRYIDEIFRELQKGWESDDVLVEKLMGEMVKISEAMEEGCDDEAQEARWRTVLEIMLKSDVVCTKICEGRYVEKLRKLMRIRGLANVIYRSIIDNPEILTGIAGSNMELAKEIVNGFIVGGYWLCWGEDELDEIVGTSSENRD